MQRRCVALLFQVITVKVPKLPMVPELIRGISCVLCILGISCFPGYVNELPAWETLFGVQVMLLFIWL